MIAMMIILLISKTGELERFQLSVFGDGAVCPGPGDQHCRPRAQVSDSLLTTAPPVFFFFISSCFRILPPSHLPFQGESLRAGSAVNHVFAGHTTKSQISQIA